MIENCEMGVETMAPSDDLPVDRSEQKSSEAQPWSYDEAFARNLGVIDTQEQQQLRNS
jgi:hypothetical protein